VLVNLEKSQCVVVAVKAYKKEPQNAAK